jgi:VIT1/CCC1 family predicted Fe2+/Mn2+ transporter
MYLSKADAHAISRAIFETQQAIEAISKAETNEERLRGYHRLDVAEKALAELGINPHFTEDSKAVSDKGFEKWWNLKKKYAA